LTPKTLPISFTQVFAMGEPVFGITSYQSGLQESDLLMELPYLALFLGIALSCFLGIFGIVKARRKKEPTYYGVSGVCFLLVIAFVAALLNQFLVFFAMIGLSFIFSIVLLPKSMALYGKEIVKQKQETNASSPLRLRDFLTWKAWIKLKATHGFRTTVTLFLLTNTGIVVAVVLAFIVLGLMAPLMAVFYTISFSVFYFIISYRQVWKALKEP
jgi:hypothetical protein